MGAIILAYLFYPLYRLSRRAIKNETIASLIVSLLVVILFTVPLILMANALSTEARINYVLIKKVLATGTVLDNCSGSLCNLIGYGEKILTEPQIKYYITDFSQKFRDFLVERTGEFIFSIPRLLVNFFIMIFVMYYLFKQGDIIVYRVEQLLPLKKAHQKNIFNQLKGVTHAVVYGHIFVSAMQAAAGMIAFWIFGVSAPILWGMTMFFFALIPLLGTPIIWIPAVIIKAASGNPGQAIGILISGIVIATADNFIKPKLVSSQAKVHPVLVLVGVIGGLSLFGLVGIIIGPVILSVLVTFIEIYEGETREITRQSP